MELPSGFVRVEAGPAVVVARAALAEALVAAGVGDPEALTQRVPSLHRGRGNLGRLDLGEAGAFVVRPLLRGGLVGKLIRRVSFDRDRAEAELRVSALVATRGASVLDVVAAVTRPWASAGRTPWSAARSRAPAT